MTTYAIINPADIDPDSPTTQSLMTRLRDNPLAIAEGDATAPRVVVPTALSTAESDVNKVLRPNGTGGVAWQSLASGAVAAHAQAGGGGTLDSSTLTLGVGERWLVIAASRLPSTLTSSGRDEAYSGTAVLDYTSGKLHKQGFMLNVAGVASVEIWDPVTAWNGSTKVATIAGGWIANRIQ